MEPSESAGVYNPYLIFLLPCFTHSCRPPATFLLEYPMVLAKILFCSPVLFKSSIEVSLNFLSHHFPNSSCKL